MNSLNSLTLANDTAEDDLEAFLDTIDCPRWVDFDNLKAETAKIDSYTYFGLPDPRQPTTPTKSPRAIKPIAAGSRLKTPEKTVPKAPRIRDARQSVSPPAASAAHRPRTRAEVRRQAEELARQQAVKAPRKRSEDLVAAMAELHVDAPAPAKKPGYLRPTAARGGSCPRSQPKEKAPAKSCPRSAPKKKAQPKKDAPAAKSNAKSTKAPAKAATTSRKGRK